MEPKPEMHQQLHGLESFVETLAMLHHFPSSSHNVGLAAHATVPTQNTCEKGGTGEAQQRDDCSEVAILYRVK